MIHDIGLERYNGLIMVKEAYNVTVKDIVSSTPGHGVSFIGTQHSLADGLHLFEPVIHAASASSRSSCNVIRKHQLFRRPFGYGRSRCGPLLK
ncbi:MAG: hypothetical protein IPM37_07340 [Hahellaceae bacterium]|nr:hypothetical protein [Hahellaceae bacterium]